MPPGTAIVADELKEGGFVEGEVVMLEEDENGEKCCEFESENERGVEPGEGESSPLISTNGVSEWKKPSVILEHWTKESSRK